MQQKKNQSLRETLEVEGTSFRKNLQTEDSMEYLKALNETPEMKKESAKLSNPFLTQASSSREGMRMSYEPPVDKRAQIVSLLREEQQVIEKYENRINSLKQRDLVLQNAQRASHKNVYKSERKKPIN